SPRKPDAASPSKANRHRAALESQWRAWQVQVIPALIPVFVRLWHKTRGLRDADALARPRAGGKCSCGKTVVLKLSVIHFTSITDITVHFCDCAPAAQQLLAHGLFPSAPWRPTLAVDLQVLELVMKLFVRISPNNTAWCATLESFLAGLGYTLESDVSL
ncbi:hypothetical protein B0H19DRAFT_889037, partial [Mycena capillaripes]